MNAGRDDDDALLWSAYLDGTLDAAARARAEARLRSSAADREMLEALRAAEEHLRTTAVPDPGAAYWRDFSARVEERLHSATTSQPDAARFYEKLASWLMNGGRVHWMRAAGALAGLTLVTYIGMRGFRPSDVQMPPQINVPPQDGDVQPPPAATRESLHEPDVAVVAPPENPRTRRGSEETRAKREIGMPAPAADAVKPQESPAIEPTRESGTKPPGTRSVEVQPQPHAAGESEALRSGPVKIPPARPDVAMEITTPENRGSAPLAGKSGDTSVLEKLARGGQQKEVFPAPDSKKWAVDFRASTRLQDHVADSVAAYLSHALREPVSSSNPQAFGEVRKQSAPSKTAAPRNGMSQASLSAEVDRLLSLADTAQPYEGNVNIRPHLATIAVRLARYASADARAASRARSLMRTLAAGSATPAERTEWEERARQLPP